MPQQGPRGPRGFPGQRGPPGLPVSDNDIVSVSETLLPPILLVRVKMAPLVRQVPQEVMAHLEGMVMLALLVMKVHQ